MKKSFRLLIVLLLYAANAMDAQVSFVRVWDKSYGGNLIEFATAFIKTNDRGYLVGGNSRSGISGTKTQMNRDTTNNTSDYYIIKVDTNGMLQWDRRFGGTLEEALYSVIQTSDSGYIMAGVTYSDSSGDVTQHAVNGYSDVWIVKIDQSGNKQWDKRFGGTGYEFASSIIQNSDGGYTIGCYTDSPANGDVSESNRDTNGYTEDYWLIRIDPVGNKLWDKRFGGSRVDRLFSVSQTNNNGYLLSGLSTSDSGADKSENSKGLSDYWIVRTDSSGNKLWDRTFGGADLDIAHGNALSLPNGNFIVSGDSYSGICPDKSEDTRGHSDFWIILIDPSGNEIRSKDVGALDFEEFKSIVRTSDNGYLLSGDSYSGAGGDKSENNLGAEQSWLVKLDSAFVKQWDKTIFTDGHDEEGRALEADDGCYVIVNFSDAGINAGYKTALTNGQRDYWIIKFCPSSINDITYPTGNFTIFPNPFNDELTITVPDNIQGGLIKIMNAEGRTLYEKNMESKILDVSFLAPGIYILELQTSLGTLYRKMVKS